MNALTPELREALDRVVGPMIDQQVAEALSAPPRPARGADAGRRRRDGTFMTPAPAEGVVAGQRAGRGPDPATPAASVSTAAALAATQRAAAGVAGAPVGAAKDTAVAAALAAASAGILAAFDRFFAMRQVDNSNATRDVVAGHLGDRAAADAAQQEREAEKAYAAKARARVAAALPEALSVSDPAERRQAVQALVDREKTIAQQRSAAVQLRALGAVEQRQLERTSPQGALWRLSPHAQTHTADCEAAAGKIWPHSVLRSWRPPLHPGCACSLAPASEAPEGTALGTADQAAHIQAMAAD